MKCIYCEKEMKKTIIVQKGLKLEGLECPKCKERVFDEKQFHKAITQLEQRRLKKEYSKKTIKIGHSYGLIFPKDLVEVFNLKNRKIKLNPILEDSKIEIKIQ
jgi:hypothetical protein